MKTCLKCQYLSVASILFFLLTACSHDNAVVQDVTPAEADKMIKDNMNNQGFIILDVRTPEEFASGHISRAINIDFRASDFETKIGQMDKNKSYLVYCRTGHRSSKAVTLMKDKGFRSLSNMNGGIMRWSEENLPVSSE
ncbi:MAG: rhodanese-like domain-containing protein [Bacteroidetes bacterium]|nr:rhodanese-like domain-containing protein [Bacteroidota bacterium]